MNVSSVGLNQLPVDILPTIFSFVPQRNLKKFIAVSRLFHEKIGDSYLTGKEWEYKFCLNLKCAYEKTEANLRAFEQGFRMASIGPAIIRVLDFVLSSALLPPFIRACLFSVLLPRFVRTRLESYRVCMNDRINAMESIQKNGFTGGINELQLALESLREQIMLARRRDVAFQEIMKLFGGEEHYMALPRLDVKNLDQGREEVDFITPDHMTSRIMRGIDRYGRHFFSIATEIDHVEGVHTFYEKNSSEGTWIDFVQGAPFIAMGRPLVVDNPETGLTAQALNRFYDHLVFEEYKSKKITALRRKAKMKVLIGADFYLRKREKVTGLIFEGKINRHIRAELCFAIRKAFYEFRETLAL